MSCCEEVVLWDGCEPDGLRAGSGAPGNEMERVLMRLVGSYSGPVPVVFIGGKLIGGMDRVMGSHINGTLVPLLKEAGALWL